MFSNLTFVSLQDSELERVHKATWCVQYDVEYRENGRNIVAVAWFSPVLRQSGTQRRNHDGVPRSASTIVSKIFSNDVIVPLSEFTEVFNV